MSASKFRAGGAMGDLTPDRELPNYNGRVIGPGENNCPLRCHAVVFDDGSRQGALVSCDATFIDRILLLRIRDACTRATGIPGNWITVAATHTHAAPATCPSFLSGALPDPLYLDFFVQRTVEAIAQAQQDLRPAVLVAGTCPTPGGEFNRRRRRPSGLAVMAGSSNSDPSFPPLGPVDRKMPFLAFTEVSGEPIAFVVNYACHNNCTGGEYHGDFGGRMGDALREEMGSETPTLFLAAPCGDVSWRREETDPLLRGDALARQIGAEMVAQLLPAYRTAKRQKIGQVRMMQRVMEIPDRSWEESTFCRDLCRGETPQAETFARRRYDPEETAVRTRGATVCPVEIQALSFGDTVLCTNPAELFVVFGIEIRKRSPFRVTLVSELTNGYCGYVGTEEAFDQQGYETHRTVYTCRLAKTAGRQLTETSVAMLNHFQAEEKSLG